MDPLVWSPVANEALGHSSSSWSVSTDPSSSSSGISSILTRTKPHLQGSGVYSPSPSGGGETVSVEYSSCSSSDSSDSSSEDDSNDEEEDIDVNRVTIDVPVMNANILEYLAQCRVKNARRIDCMVSKDLRSDSNVYGSVLADTGASRNIFPYKLIKKMGATIDRDKADRYR